MGSESTESKNLRTLTNELRVVLDSIHAGIIAVDINGKITFNNENGKKFMGCGEEVIGCDVNELIPQLHSVQELYSELSALIDSSADGLVITDGKGFIIRMNKAYRLMLGIPLEENFT
jgi:sensor histidine kinase regulating citrate/malate metabolism